MKTIYEGNGYWITLDEDETYYFEDDNETCPLKHKLNDPSYIKFDENKGWCYKNGKELPWA